MIPFSALVVTYNEERYLDECLRRLAFCDDIVVIDLGSADRSVDIAQAAGARVIRHPWVPIVEHVRPFGLSQARHDWVFVVDPDEVLPSGMDAILRKRIAAPDGDRIGAIGLPKATFFLGEPLRGGRKGGIRYDPRLVIHRQRTELPRTVHAGVRLHDGFHSVNLTELREPVRHYWCDTLSELLAKYPQQGSQEGERWHRKGYRFSWIRTARMAARVFASDLRAGAVPGGPRAWLVATHSVLFTVYGQLMLREYQRRFNGIK